ncbi:hypothetical protein ACLOJK_003551 [Asimina triloba]
MGKKQHSKDRMFITKTEWATEWGGAKSKQASAPFKRLPFYCCALVFTPFEDPVCTIDGSVFDIMNIVPYIKKHGKHPVTGAPLKVEDLVPLTFHKNADEISAGQQKENPFATKVYVKELVYPGTTSQIFKRSNPWFVEDNHNTQQVNMFVYSARKGYLLSSVLKTGLVAQASQRSVPDPIREYHCPVLNKVFTEFTHIVAVKTTGNVFCYEAIKELNLKTKNWKELLTDKPFTKEDLITIQNPNALDSKVLTDFDHVKNSLKLDDEGKWF